MIHKPIKCLHPTSLYRTVTAHGWVHLAPWCWDMGSNELSRPERLGNGNIVSIKVYQVDALTLIAQIDVETLEQQEHEEIESIVKRWLSLDWNPVPAIRLSRMLNPRIAFYIKHGGGRFLRCSTFYEDFVKTVCTINTNWASTRRMVSSLVNQLGNGVFPTPLDIMGYGENALRKDLRLGFRARVLVESSRQLLEERWIDDEGNLKHKDIQFEDLIALRGIGPYSASHLMMLTHNFRRIPIDSEVPRYCRDYHNVDPQCIDTFFGAWGAFRVLGYKLSRIVDGTN